MNIFTCELCTMFAIGPVMIRPVMMERMIARPSRVPIWGRRSRLKHRAWTEADRRIAPITPTETEIFLSTAMSLSVVVRHRASVCHMLSILPGAAIPMLTIKLYCKDHHKPKKSPTPPSRPTIKPNITAPHVKTVTADLSFLSCRYAKAGLFPHSQN